MVKKELIEQIENLPPEAQQEAADFVDYLSKKYPRKAQTSSDKSFLDSAFRGMWKNREDMKDSTQWVRKIRKSRYAE